jgi:hypothetical protein
MRLADVSECLSTYFENISISSPFCDNGAPAKRGVAVFQRYGHRYFLDEISISAGSGRFFLRPSKEETQLQIAASKTRIHSLDRTVDATLAIRGSNPSERLDERIYFSLRFLAQFTQSPEQFA